MCYGKLQMHRPLTATNFLQLKQPQITELGNLVTAALETNSYFYIFIFNC